MPSGFQSADSSDITQGQARNRALGCTTKSSARSRGASMMPCNDPSYEAGNRGRLVLCSDGKSPEREGDVRVALLHFIQLCAEGGILA